MENFRISWVQVPSLIHTGYFTLTNSLNLSYLGHLGVSSLTYPHPFKVVRKTLKLTYPRQRSSSPNPSFCRWGNNAERLSYLFKVSPWVMELRFKLRSFGSSSSTFLLFSPDSQPKPSWLKAGFLSMTPFSLLLVIYKASAAQPTGEIFGREDSLQLAVNSIWH